MMQTRDKIRNEVICQELEILLSTTRPAKAGTIGRIVFSEWSMVGYHAYALLQMNGEEASWKIAE